MIKAFECYNEDCEYKDFEMYADNVKGKDWRFTFFLNKESGKYTDIMPHVSEPNEPYNECGIEMVPSKLIVQARALRELKIKQEMKRKTKGKHLSQYAKEG